MNNNLKRIKLEALQACPLCIICAKSDEAITVRDQLGASTVIHSNNVDQIPDGIQFFQGLLPVDKGKIPYYITSSTRQGIQSFATQAATLFTILKPAYAIHVGVCSAINKQDIKVEDVIFGHKALNYEEGKWEIEEKDGNEKRVFKPDTETFAAKADALNGFVTEMARPYWKQGDYISGCAVRMDAKYIFDRVNKGILPRKVKALEMEASAFFQVCQFTNVEALGVIKGVSDMGDKYKGIGNDQHYGAALRKAANAAFDYAKSRLKQEDLARDDLEKQPGAMKVTEYFDNFVTSVLNKVHAAKLSIYIGKESVKMRGFRIVLPKDNNVNRYKNLEIKIHGQGLREVFLPGGARSTPVWTKGPYLVDLPTTLTDLEFCVDMADQVEIFKDVLLRKIEELDEGGFTKVITYDEFISLCQEVDGALPSPGTPSPEIMTKKRKLL